MFISKKSQAEGEPTKPRRIRLETLLGGYHFDNPIHKCNEELQCSASTKSQKRVFM